MSKADLEPFLRRVDQRRKKNPENPLWEHLEKRWLMIESHATAILGDSERGRAGQKNEVEAAREILATSSGASAREAVDAALAMYLMHGWEPNRFRSDRAFWTQLVRRVRGVAPQASGETLSASGRKGRVYREMGPRTVDILKGWLTEAFGVAGLRLVQLEQSEIEAKRNEQREFRKALGDLK